MSKIAIALGNSLISDLGSVASADNAQYAGRGARSSVASAVSIPSHEMAKTAVIICILIPAVWGQCTVEKAKPFFSRSIYEFSIDLMRRLALDTEYHFVASPLSAWTLLAHTSLGAAGGSLEELTNVLRLHPHKCFNRKSFDIIRDIYHPADRTTLEGASIIATDDRYAVKGSFVRKVEKAGISKVMPVSMDNVEFVAASINEFVRSATNGTIDEIVQASDLNNVAMIIVDALRFKAGWKLNFPTEATKVSPFYDENNSIIGSVNLMHIFNNYRFKYVDKIKATVVEVPYNDEKFSMLLFVPYPFAKLNDVLFKLKTVSLNSLFAMLEQQDPLELTLELPRFQVSSDLSNLKELLIDMGLGTIFDDRAQFPDISDYPLYISNLIQKADIEVTEEGTTASAVTEAEFSVKSLPDTAIANKPFFYMIVDKENLIPVFVGVYSKPSVY